MMTFFRYFLLIIMGLVSIFLSSCQKEIEVDIPDYDRKIVIEGRIENGSPAMVIVSRSVPYFDHIDLQTLMNDVFITDAVVTVSCDGVSEQLRLMPWLDSPIYFAYVGDTTSASCIKGEPGKRYDLRVEIGDKVYTSSTTIVEPFHLDSVWLAFANEQDTTPTTRIQLTDRPETHDYYMFQLKVHGKRLHDRLWVTSFPVAFDDATFNGQTVNYEILRANPSSLFESTMTDEEKEEFYRVTYRKGDTIYMKTSLIDYDGFQYWSAMTYAISLGQNPFMSPAPVPCNIKGENVIGNWCGFASTIDTIYYLDDTQLRRRMVRR
jgi:hypothetical protein